MTFPNFVGFSSRDIRRDVLRYVVLETFVLGAKFVK